MNSYSPKNNAETNDKRRRIIVVIKGSLEKFPKWLMANKKEVP